MNTLLCLTTLLAAVCLSSAASPQYRASVIAALTSCAPKYNFSPKAVIDFIKANKLPETKEQKCLAGCIFDKMGYVNDMKIDWVKMKEANPQKYDTPDLVAKADQVVAACSKVVQEKVSDICELAVPAMQCMYKVAAEKQLPLPDLKLNLDINKSI